MSNKHDANVRKSALVNFQIGLIASLLFTFAMFEVYTSEPIAKVVVETSDTYDPVVNWNPNFKVYVAPQPKSVVQKRVAVAVIDPNKFKEVPDDTAISEFKDALKSTPSAEVPFDPSTVQTFEDPEDSIVEDVPFSVVEDVPVFPGCEKLKTNREKAACFNEKIRRIISRKFNGDIGSQYGLSGEQRIYTVFDVASDGTIQNVQVRAPHPRLKKEAERVIGFFPKMTPGKQRGKAVTVKYQLPIMFKIEN